MARWGIDSTSEGSWGGLSRVHVLPVLAQPLCAGALGLRVVVGSTGCPSSVQRCWVRWVSKAGALSAVQACPQGIPPRRRHIQVTLRLVQAPGDVARSRGNTGFGLQYSPAPIP